MEDTTALTVRVPKALGRQLAVHKALTGISVNELANRLLAEYMSTEGTRQMTEAGFARTDVQYETTLQKLA